jgi:SAM-dependent methyltransferase
VLDKGAIERILAHYPHASPLQRWHMRGRLHLCPYDALLKHLTGQGDLLDIGCGFGHLAWYLAEARPAFRYHGADIDERKVALALGCPVPAGSHRPVVRQGDVRKAAGLPESFGNIVILDVVYLMPWELQVEIMEWALGRLSREPGSVFVLKSMEAPTGASGLRAVLEEWIMVHLLRRTRSSGTIVGARPASAYQDFARERGFRCDREDLATFNPSFILRMYR